MKNKKVEVQDWGLIDYKTAWDKQEAIFADTIGIKTAIRNREPQVADGDITNDTTPNYM